MNDFIYRAWRPWSNVEGGSPRHFAAICVWHLQELSFRHSSTTVVGKESDSNAIEGVVLLLPPRHWVVSVSAAGAHCLWWQHLCYGREREPDFKSADVILEVRLLPPSRWATTVEVSGVVGALFSKQALVRGRSVWGDLELYSWALPAPVPVHDVDWFALADLCFKSECCFLIGHSPVVKCLDLLKCVAWFYMHWELDTRTS